VSSHDQLHNLRALQSGWGRPLKEAKLRPFLQTRFNIQLKRYMTHLLPILLLRTLCATQMDLEKKNSVYKIEFAKTRKKKDEAEVVVPLQRKISFLAQKVTFEWKSENDETFGAQTRTECEMLEYALG
jgi:hypothetical protein